MIPSSQWNEAETRYNSIDPLLKKAKWDLADRREVAFEVPVNGYDQTPENEITDYTLFRPNGEVLAVIEAKRTKRDARVGKEQLKQYLDKIEAGQGFRPFGFLMNGMDIWFWDSVEYPERAIAGFYTKDDLERLLYLQQNKLPLPSILIKESILNRGYQTEAVRRIGERIDLKKKRKALLVTGDWWTAPTVTKADEARKTLAPLMKYKRDKPSPVIEVGLDDIIESRKWVVLSKGAGGQKMMVEEYKAKVEARIQQIASEHPVVQRLIAGEAVSLQELLSLESTLELELRSDSGLALSEDNMLKAFGVRVGALTDFLKYVLRLEEVPLFDEVVKHAFDTFIGEHEYNADQTRFLRTVQQVFMDRRKLAVDDLYEAPFTNFGMGAVERLFTNGEVDQIIELTQKLAS